jgi:hypothetical protein
MKFAPLAAIVAMALTTSACVIIDADDHQDVSVNMTKSDLEPIFGATIDKDALVVRVSSNGCTRLDDFAVETQRRDGAATFTFTRKRPNLCRALVAEGVDMRFYLDAYGVDRGSKIRVRNPMVRP